MQKKENILLIFIGIVTFLMIFCRYVGFWVYAEGILE